MTPDQKYRNRPAYNLLVNTIDGWVRAGHFSYTEIMEATKLSQERYARGQSRVTLMDFSDQHNDEGPTG